MTTEPKLKQALAYTPETAGAAKTFRNERTALIRAIESDHDHGISANEIARMANGTLGRPVILEHLSARTLQRDLRGILREAKLDGVFGIQYPDAFSRQRRHVQVCLAVDPVEVERKPQELTTLLVQALSAHDIKLAVSDLGKLQSLLWEGEQVRVNRAGRQ